MLTELFHLLRTIEGKPWAYRAKFVGLKILHVKHWFFHTATVLTRAAGREFFRCSSSAFVHWVYLNGIDALLLNYTHFS
jgi:hypothetical protein